VTTLRARQRGDAVIDDRFHDLEAGADGECQQTLAK
jgi:hypothetical protein